MSLIEPVGTRTLPANFGPMRDFDAHGRIERDGGDTMEAWLRLDARKAITFCRSCSIPVLGIVENMSGFVCPSCHTSTPVFQSGGGARLAQELGLPFLGTLPLDPSVGAGSEATI